MPDRALAWNWVDAGRSALCVVPAALAIAFGDPSKGLAWAIGILPAASVGMAPTRRGRANLVLIGALFAVSILFGSLLSQAAVVAVVGIFLVAYGSAILASRRAFGQVAMTLCAPVAAIGLSYGDLGEATGLALLMLAGSIWSFAIVMLWPEQLPQADTPPPPLMSPAFARHYGVLLGLAAASSAAVGEAIHTDHVGWATAAAMFVMRPKAEMQELRSVGRVASVFLGALIAVLFVRTDPSAAAVAIMAVAAIAGVAATRQSRWYVSPMFSTVLVLTLLLYSDATTTTEQWRFNERVGATMLGVGFAYLYGLAIPQIAEVLRGRFRGGASGNIDSSGAD
jgi:hypothetical protein